MRMSITSVCLALGVAALSSAAAQQTAAPALPDATCAQSQSCAPKVVLAAILIEMAAGNPQEAVVDEHLRGLDRGATDEANEVALAEILFLDFKPRESTNLYRRYLSRDDAVGRLAWQRVMQMEFRAFNRPDEVQNMLRTYHERFSYARYDRQHDFLQVFNFSGARQEAGDLSGAVDVIVQAVREAPLDAPYQIHLVPERSLQLFRDANRLEDARALMQRSRDGLQATLDARAACQASPSEEAELNGSGGMEIVRMLQGVRPNETVFDARTAQLTAIIARLDAALSSIR